MNLVDAKGLMGDAPKETIKEVVKSISHGPADTAGKAILEGGTAVPKGIHAMARKDYNYYMSGEGHLEFYKDSPISFENVNWKEYGDTFEEAFKNFWKETMEDNPCP